MDNVYVLVVEDFKLKVDTPNSPSTTNLSLFFKPPSTILLSIKNSPPTFPKVNGANLY